MKVKRQVAPRFRKNVSHRADKAALKTVDDV
jgi:hypothetical protein